MKFKIKTILSLGIISIVGACSSLPINALSEDTICKKVVCSNKNYEEYLYVNINGKEYSTSMTSLNCLINNVLNSNCNKVKTNINENKIETPNKNKITNDKTSYNKVKKHNKVNEDSSIHKDNSKQNLNSENPKPNKQLSTVNSNFINYQKEVLNLVNKERTSRGLSALKLNDSLSNVATTKSQDMIDKNYFDHTSPTYGSPFDMMKRFGISYNAAGENIAMGQSSPQEVMNSWMNSPGHRKNILNPNFTELGVGVAKKGSTLYWTQMFIGK